MKRCPTCQKEFADSMRFCQTDGTPLVETAEAAPPEDPFKTMVGQPMAEDPFKTVVGGNSAADQSKDNDILQLPDESADPMKTMVVSPEDWKKDDSSASANELPVPEPPKFSEPDLNPPVFGDLSPQPPSGSTGDIFGSSSSSSTPPNEPKISDSPFGQPPVGSPFQSPFEQQKSSFEPPSPFDAPPSPSFDAPKPPPYKEPESPFGSQQTPFDQSPFSQPQVPSGQMGNDPFASQQPQAEWNPPPVPVQNWQDQNLGANTPFQPPPANAGQNNTLAVVSLVLGVLSFLCLGPLGAIPAIITGYMQRNNIKNNPSEYGGGGMAMAGMILGGIYLVITLIFIVIWLLLILSNARF
ncbi:MAG TPA: DUF4190 domain-containing protein [Pyrinomonadaceae bacterium]|jgi:hypothetical protein